MSGTNILTSAPDFSSNYNLQSSKKMEYKTAKLKENVEKFIRNDGEGQQEVGGIREGNLPYLEPFFAENYKVGKKFSWKADMRTIKMLLNLIKD